MTQVLLYTTRFCPFCVRAKQLFDNKDIAYQEIPIDGKPELRTEMINRSGLHTVPQIWIDDKHIGGCDEVWALERSGELDQLLMNVSA